MEKRYTLLESGGIMNDYSHGPTVQGDANSSALLTHQQRQDKRDLEYEEREANAPADLYEDEAREMIIEALTGGKDDIDITGCLVERFKKDCAPATRLPGCKNARMADHFVFATPDHLERLVRWTVQDLIKDWVAHRIRDYAETTI